MATESTTRTTSPPPGSTRLPRQALVLVGVGLGAFVDGIVLHQLLQWHHLVSARRHPDDVAGLRLNVLADGLFHLGAWVLVLVGLVLLLASWRRGAPRPRAGEVAGLLLVGWALFNLTEGVVNHQLLGVHHVRDDLGGPLSWDLGFLAVALLLLVGGLLLARGDTRTRAASSESSGSPRHLRG